MRALVTGGAGFMGSHVAEALLNGGQQVVVVDDLSGGAIENVPEGATFIEGSVVDTAFVNGLFEAYTFDYIYHLAAYAAEGLSFFIKRFNYQNNLIGSINLINGAVNHDVKCFVFTSSIAVYGALKPPFVESMVPWPEDPYGIAKYAVECDLRVSKEMWDLNYIVFRPHNVYGERQNLGDKYRNVIGIFMNQVMNGEDLTIFGDGKQTRAFSYVKDVADVIAQAVFRPEAYNQVFNIGSDVPVAVNDLAKYVLDVMHSSNRIVHLEPRNEVLHAHSSHQKLKEVLGCEAKTGLRDGLIAMAEWARQIGSKKTREFSTIEVKKNMPKSWR